MIKLEEIVENETGQTKFDKAFDCLKDNGIEYDDDVIEVLQALCYVLMDYELSKNDFIIHKDKIDKERETNHD